MSAETEAYRRLIDIGRALSAESDLDQLLESILREAKRLTNADAGSLYLVSGESLCFAVILNDSLNLYQGGVAGSQIDLPDLPLYLNDSSPNTDNVATRAIHSGEVIYVSNVYSEQDRQHTDEPKRYDRMTGYQSRSFLTVPMFSHSGEPLGVIQLLNARNEDGSDGDFAVEVQPLVESLASLASVALENRQLLDEQLRLKGLLEQQVDERTNELQSALDKLSEAHRILQDLTTIDAVTGIRNRQYFDDYIDKEWKRAVRQHYPITVLMLDIDHFKAVNDTWGHLAGDQCLATIARLQSSYFKRPSDVLARYGGEEFVAVLPYCEYEGAMQLAEEIRAAVEALVIQVDGYEIRVTISIGVGTVIPREGVGIRDLLARADEALYASKHTGRNRVRGIHLT
ncbi:MAG: sensor domain-containing diguanylate cyclase [Pseudomonadales bacterium]|nr:sensor domain-containing diguanylate cyclase [Pseudomonadales bacterium]